ncbi:MAG: hypothetical protein KDD11_14090 [Acidobacteria bacterium]|nr:hypothetical protein [Acidobacteriota bacterium]
MPSGADDLARRLRHSLDKPLASLTLTDNRSTILSARPSPRGLAVRVHRSFAGAPDPVVEALAEVAAGGRHRRAALAVVREHFRRHRPEPPRRPHRASAGEARGRHFDLAEIRDRVNQAYFGGLLDVAIAWGRAPVPRRRPQRRRTIHLGTYRADLNLVRIHPVLDRRGVPLYVVESVVHHEMLHAAMPATVVAGRRRLHTPEFRRRERLFADHERAQAWIEDHLDQLLAARYRR